ncbi:hypothetical protein ACFX1Q_000055 [Malus domestica]
MRKNKLTKSYKYAPIKKAKKSKGTCFHCGKDERWKKKYRGLAGSRSLSNGEMIVRVGNGTKILAKAIGTYMLNLPSGKSWNFKIVYIFLHV